MLALQGFLDDSLRVHRINFNKLSGAACQSVITGVYILILQVSNPTA